MCVTFVTRSRPEAAMTCALVKKLEAYAELTDEERIVVERASARPQLVASRTDIIREGDQPSDVHLVTSGLACRYKLLEDGRRQIVAYLIPGDFCDLDVFILKRMDHTIAAISQVQMVWIPREQMLDLMSYANISRAMWLVSLVDEATLREWVTNVGQRSAEHRLAHLFCELFLRMKIVGLTSQLEFELPITQAELGDTLGLSTVHVNRSLQSLKAANLVTFKGKKIIISDMARLKRLSGFRDNYLHLDTISAS